MKAMIFAFNDLGSSTLADTISCNLENSDWETVVCDYSLTGGFNPRRLKRSTKSSLLTLADLGYGSIPQLSSRQYREAFGDDMDFPAISGLSFYTVDYPNNYPLSNTFLNTESIFYQRLRGFSARIDQLLRAIKPDLVIVQQGSEAISRLIAGKALKKNIPQLCWESPFFLGYLLLDPAGQHFLPGRNKIELDWPSISTRVLTTAETGRLTQFIQDWKGSRTSKYQQDINLIESERLASFLAAGTGPVLFVPMQIPLDANVYHGLGGFSSLEQFYSQLVAHLPPGWRAIFKHHPKNHIAPPQLDKSDSRVLVVREANIHELISVADVVAVFSSNVGLEALLYGKPVIAGGKPYYGGKGLTLDVRTGEELPVALEQALTWHPDLALRDRLVRYLLDDYLIREDDTPALLRRVEEARGGLPETDPRCPFAECDPPISTEYIDLIRRYDELARQNLMPSEILPQLEIPGFCTLPEAQLSDLGSGERQASAWVTRIEPGHLSRYALVASVIPLGQHVLDLACGVGYGAYMLADRAQSSVVAVDGSRDTIDYALANWAHLEIAYQAASAGTFFMEDTGREYDVIVSFETIEHLRDADLFLEQAWQRLRPGGVLFVSTPNSDVYPLLNHPFHVEHYDVPTLLEALSRLPDVGACQIYWQHRNVIAAAPSHDSRFLIGALFKAPKESGWVLPPDTLAAALPFTYNPPSAEFSSLTDIWKMLARRRFWLRRLLLRR